jgi:carbon-monoxide dehydrogenase small subunit
MNEIRISVSVNGKGIDAEIEPRTLLVKFLRENLGLTGTHVGCETTNCGACTVLLDGRAVKSCTVFAAQADGKRVTTIEGVGGPENLDPVQLAFWEKHGLQCGFCTPGMIMATEQLLAENPDPDEDEIRAALSGNLCRCTGYVKIIDAVRYASQLKRRGTPGKKRETKGKREEPSRAREVEGM